MSDRITEAFGDENGGICAYNNLWDLDLECEEALEDVLANDVAFTTRWYSCTGTEGTASISREDGKIYVEISIEQDEGEEDVANTIWHALGAEDHAVDIYASMRKVFAQYNYSPVNPTDEDIQQHIASIARQARFAGKISGTYVATERDECEPTLEAIKAKLEELYGKCHQELEQRFEALREFVKHAVLEKDWEPSIEQVREKAPRLPAFATGGDGAHRGLADWYPERRKALEEAVNSRQLFTTGWYSVKHAIQSANITSIPEETESNTQAKVSSSPSINLAHVEVSVSIDNTPHLLDTIIWEVLGENDYAGSGYEALQRFYREKVQPKTDQEIYDELQKLADEADEINITCGDNNCAAREDTCPLTMEAIEETLNRLADEAQQELNEMCDSLRSFCRNHLGLPNDEGDDAEDDDQPDAILGIDDVVRHRQEDGTYAEEPQS